MAALAKMPMIEFFRQHKDDPFFRYLLTYILLDKCWSLDDIEELCVTEWKDINKAYFPTPATDGWKQRMVELTFRNEEVISFMVYDTDKTMVVNPNQKGEIET